MTEQAISPLRRRMIEDMSIRVLRRPNMTVCKGVMDFAAFLGRSPDTAKSEDVCRFRLHLASNQSLVHVGLLVAACRKLVDGGRLRSCAWMPLPGWRFQMCPVLDTNWLAVRQPGTE